MIRASPASLGLSTNKSNATQYPLIRDLCPPPHPLHPSAPENTPYYHGLTHNSATFCTALELDTVFRERWICPVAHGAHRFFSERFCQNSRYRITLRAFKSPHYLSKYLFLERDAYRLVIGLRIRCAAEHTRAQTRVPNLAPSVIGTLGTDYTSISFHFTWRRHTYLRPLPRRSNALYLAPTYLRT